MGSRNVDPSENAHQESITLAGVSPRGSDLESELFKFIGNLPYGLALP
jgi:hypothetical protein